MADGTASALWRLVGLGLPFVQLAGGARPERICQGSAFDIETTSILHKMEQVWSVSRLGQSNSGTERPFKGVVIKVVLDEMTLTVHEPNHTSD